MADSSRVDSACGGRDSGRDFGLDLVTLFASGGRRVIGAGVLVGGAGGKPEFTQYRDDSAIARRHRASKNGATHGFILRCYDLSSGTPTILSPSPQPSLYVGWRFPASLVPSTTVMLFPLQASERFQGGSTIQNFLQDLRTALPGLQHYHCKLLVHLPPCTPRP